MPDTWFFDVLPCRPVPYEDECLTGYLLRLAATNGTADFRAFVLNLFPSWPGRGQISLLRWEYPLAHWHELSQRVQLPEERLKRMTMLPWVAKFRTPSVQTEDRPLYPGGMLRGIVRSSLQVCPLCLQEKPYQRLLWRLQPVAACVTHGCWLQQTCHHCGQLLPVTGNKQQHLQCGLCQFDLRQLPILPAPEAVLAEEARRQPDWRYLLDPTTNLMKENEVTADCSVSRVVGLKLRYLRHQTGLSPAEIAQQIEPSASQIRTVEHGWEVRRVPLAAYLSYLEGLGYSWLAFAALNVPAEFFAAQLQPQYMALRICPTPDCPNHLTPTKSGVILRRHFPERGLVVLKCKRCRRRFTRTYAGELVTKYRRPPLPPGTRVNTHKPAEEVEQARQLGLQGRSNRHITKCLGWTQETIRNCWKALDIEEEVRTAQKQRRRQKGEKLRETLQMEVEKILDSLCQQEERITFVAVTKALGRRGIFLFRYPETAERIREVAAQHHAQLKQRRLEELEVKLKQAIAEYQESNMVMTIRYLSQQAGCTPWLLQYHYPELWAMVRAAVAANEEQRRTRRVKQQCQQINETAARLSAQGIRLTKSALIEETRKVIPITTTHPQVDELLNGWIGDLEPSN
jgi:hypothetical protein